MLLQQDIHAEAKFWLDAVDVAVKLTALLVGGAWTWMHYSRSRTHRRRAEIDATGVFFKKGAKLYLAINCRLRNLGQSKFVIKKKGTSSTVWALMSDGTEVTIATPPVFEIHEWVEPGGRIDNPALIEVTLDAEKLVAVRVELQVTSSGVIWNTRSLIQHGDEETAAVLNPASSSAQLADHVVFESPTH